MVYAMLQRSACRYDHIWFDGLARFGVALLVGLNRRVHLIARDYPYEWLPQGVANDNKIG